MAVKHRILLLGGSGQLGREILDSKIFSNIYSPNKKMLNILDKRKIIKYLSSNKITIIINCAAKARMDYCEKFQNEAFKVNVIGVANIFDAIKKTNIKFIHFSTDAVYGFNTKNNKENSNISPFNVYGLTKICSEFYIKQLNNYIIIRTRFFLDKKKFNSYAIDMINSAINIRKIPAILQILIKKNFKGIINIGGKNNSNYNRAKKIDNKIKKTSWNKIYKKNRYIIAKECTMNLKKMRSIVGNKID
jgi:dTDP-4-dehydrorhamnose reductase